MQEVTKAVERARADMARDPDEENKPGGAPGELLEAAEKWAKASLNQFGGELLRKALLMAAAMAEFAYEAHNPS